MSFARGALLFVIAAAAALALLTPIGSYDFFWHLATGRWIAEHGSLPRNDPFGVASSRMDWINGEWLFQVAAWKVWSAGGAPLTIVLRSLLALAGVCLVLVHARRFASMAIVAALTALAVYGAEHRLTYRPEAVATLFLVIALALSFMDLSARRRVIFFALLTILWVNVHPSALLAPVVYGGGALSRFLKGDRNLFDWAGGVVAALALLANPWGLRGVVAPIELARLASSSAFVNREWLPTRLGDFPVVYLTILLAVVSLAKHRRQLTPYAGEIALLALFSILALRYVRNHGFFFVAIAMLLPPFLPEIDRRLRPIAVTIAVLLLLFVAVSPPLPTLAIDSEKLPVQTTRLLAASRLSGNVYNPDQFGGFLIHALYPERRVLTDGRNELYREFIPEVIAAREDSKKWERLLQKYDVRLAMEDYRGEAISSVDPTTGIVTPMAASLAYFPRRDWALIGFDDAAMLFARRESHPRAVLDQIEFTKLVPDDPRSLRKLTAGERAIAKREIERAERQIGWSQILQAMKKEVAGAS